MDFVVEVANVTNNSHVLHLGHMLKSDNVLAASGSNKDVHLVDHIFNTDHFVALHTCLKRTDGINLSDVNTSTGAPHALTASFGNIAVATDKHLLA